MIATASTGAIAAASTGALPGLLYGIIKWDARG